MFDFLITRNGHGMFEHHEGQVRVIQGLLLRLRNRQKSLGDDADSWNTGFLEID
jgi:hypothetical protein